MARQKEPAKPLFTLKHDFVAALENVCHEAIMLMQTVDAVAELAELPEPLKVRLIERSKAMRAALSAED